MIINLENTSLHKYLAKMSKSLRMLRSEMTKHSFLVLIQN